MLPDSNPFPGLWGPVDFRPIPKSLPVPSQPSGAGRECGARGHACDALVTARSRASRLGSDRGRGDESDR